MPGNVVECYDQWCGESFPSSKFGKIRASDAGWFFQKDGVAWCPAHIPEWVGPWRARKREEAEMQSFVIAVAGGSVTVNSRGGKLSCSYQGELPRDIALEVIRRSEAAHPSGIKVNDKPVAEFAEELLGGE